ncbi:DUF1275 family protein [Streptomyces sp. PR69]|uniref:DUF1275 family protein n=1 Tax=Streptomyces sp. PR69 TaxID=2984950 RepID=UPI002263E0D8|nr:DUF1275 family protein [Streptomyces sp. PR69]
MARTEARGHRWLIGALCAEAALLGVAGLAGWGIEAAGRTLTPRHCAVTATVAAAMGLQAVAAMRARVRDVPTVVVTSTLTAFLSVPPRAPSTAKTPSGPRHQGRRAAAAGAMFTGGLLGAWLLHRSVSPAAVLLAATGERWPSGSPTATSPTAAPPYRTDRAPPARTPPTRTPRRPRPYATVRMPPPRTGTRPSPAIGRWAPCSSNARPRRASRRQPCGCPCGRC